MMDPLVQEFRNTLVVVLGHENDRDGNLSDDALSRISAALEYVSGEPSDAIDLLATGGYGDYFNLSDRAHGALMLEEIAKSAPSDLRRLGWTASCGTDEDILALRRLLVDARSKPRCIRIFTSAYHAPRAELLASKMLPEFSVVIESDDNEGTPSQQRHEEKRTAQLARELPTFSSWNTCDPSLLEGLLSELRHYDNISYLPLVASFAIPFFAATNTISVEGSAFNVVVSILGLCLSLALLSMYWRLAGTAASARRTARYYALYCGYPNLSSAQNLMTKRTIGIGKSVGLAWLLGWGIAMMAKFAGI